MAEYVGRRIVPRHAGVWAVQKEYEELMVVLDAATGDSYISRLPVPAGTALSDENYWMLFSLYSAQIAEAEKHLEDTAAAVREELAGTEKRIGETLSETESRIGESLTATENRLNARVDVAREDLGAQVTDASGQLSEGLAKLEETRASLQARMDSIASGTTEDTEILDARVDSEGETHASLGEAVRSIYPKVEGALASMESRKLDAEYDATGELTQGISVNTNHGQIQEFATAWTTDFIQIDPACQKVYYSGRVFNWIGVAGYDAQGTFVAALLDSRDTEEPRDYVEEELVIPETVSQIRASSYNTKLTIRVKGESGKLWERVRDAHIHLSDTDQEIKNLYGADDYLAKESMNALTFPFLYNSTGIWSASSPILQTYYVPLTVLKDAYIEAVDFLIRTTGSTTLTVTLERETEIVFSQTVDLAQGDIPVTLLPCKFIAAGAYRMRLSAADKVLCYPTRYSSSGEIRNDYFSNEPSGDVTYDFSNRLIVFMGKITIRTGGVDPTLSIEGMPADSAAVGNQLKEGAQNLDNALRDKLDKVRSRNLLDPSKYRPGWFAFTNSSNVTFHEDNLRYGATDYIPVSENGLVTVGSGTNGVTSQIIYDKDRNPLRHVDANDQYTYEEGDAYVVFCYFKSSAETLAVVEGTEYVFEKYSDYRPLDILTERVETLEGNLESQGSELDALEDRVDLLENGPQKQALAFVPAAPVYTVCNDLNTARNYHVSVWIDHLIRTTGWKDQAAGFGDTMEQGVDFYSPFTNTAINGGEDVLEQAVKLEFISEAYTGQELSFTHRSTLASMGRSAFPKVLVIGDSVTDGYLAGINKGDSSLPNHYWAWVKYLFELDRKDAGGDEDSFNCLMVGMMGTIDGKRYGSSTSFQLDGKTHQNYAVAKGGWSAEDLNLPTFESETNINPFYDETTGKFSLKAFLNKYKTLADDGVIRLVAGETAGTEVTNVNAYNLCTPTHVVINLNHNSPLAEYQEVIPGIVKTIQAEYPGMIIILMSIDETGTYFPAKYPQYAPGDITIGSLHQKNLEIYQYFCEELQDEANGVYVCSGHLVQPPVESYPSIEYCSADSVGRQDTRKLRVAYGRGQYGGPNWHPNNYAHCAWGYQLYALIKYTLALQEME